MNQDPFLQAILDQIARYNMHEPGEGWLLAISGGCDSMAMLAGLTRLWRSGELAFQKLHVAHLDHQLRGAQSEADGRFVKEQAGKLGLPVTLESVDIAGEAQKSGESIELAARRIRYEFLSRQAHQHGCQKIALAHNADDSAETILHRILRGTGIRGLAGIPAVRLLDDGELQIIRPLLSLTRAEIETFLTENQINWRFDQSNESRDYTRNRIRLDLLPLLKEQYNPNVVASLLQLGQTAEDVQSIIVVDAGYSLKELMVEEQADSIRLDAEELQTKPRIEQAEIIREAMEKLHIPQRQIGFKQMASILALLASPDEKKTLQLPAGWQVERNQRFLTLRKKGHPSILTDTESGSIIPDYPVQLSGQTSPPPGFIYIDSQNQQQPAAMIQTQILDGTKQTLDEFRKTKQANEEMLDYDAIKGSLVLRPWREGDRFGPLGAAGDKTLGDFFTDVKLASQWRKYIGLICDEEGILWVMGLRIAERVKISSQTKHILKLRVG